MDVLDPNLKDRFFVANLHNCKLSNKLQIYPEIKQLIKHIFITSENNQECDEETIRKTKAMAFSKEGEEQSPLRHVGPAPSAELTRLVFSKAQPEDVVSHSFPWGSGFRSSQKVLGGLPLPLPPLF